MRRMSFKARKGKAASNDNSEEPDTQDNGNAAPEGSEEEEESASEEVKSESPRKKSKRGKKNEVKTDDDEGSSISSDEDSKSSKKKGKRNKKGNDREAETEQKRKRSTKIETPVKDNESDEEEMEQEYEVEQVVDFKVVDGVRQFKIRWRGYSEKGDTWEQEEDLNCKDLIDGYFENHPESEKVSKKSSKSSKKHKKQKNNVEPKAKKRKAEVEPVAEEDGEKIYEVDRVLEVHFKKNGRREFLIRWKGFSGQDDTWEPEENLNCPDLIEKFMKKVNEAKSLSARELRANPQTTDRFILTADQKGRRLSPRYRGRSRQTYYNVE